MGSSLKHCSPSYGQTKLHLKGDQYEVVAEMLHCGCSFGWGGESDKRLSYSPLPGCFCSTVFLLRSSNEFSNLARNENRLKSI